MPGTIFAPQLENIWTRSLANMLPNLVLNSIRQRFDERQAEIQAKRQEALLRQKQVYDEGLLKQEQAFQERLKGAELVAKGYLTPSEAKIPDTTLAGTGYTTLPQREKPVSLAQGATLVDPTTGQEIARGTPKPPTLPALQKNYEYARTQGFRGSLEDFMRVRQQNINVNVSKVPIHLQKGYIEALNAEDMIDNLITQLDKIPARSGPEERIYGQAAKLGAAVGLDPDLKVYQDLRKAAASWFSKGIFREAGVLTNQDIKRALGAIPAGRGETMEERKRKKKILRDIGRKMRKNAIRGMQVFTPGFTDIPTSSAPIESTRPGQLETMTDEELMKALGL